MMMRENSREKNNAVKHAARKARKARLSMTTLDLTRDDTRARQGSPASPRGTDCVGITDSDRTRAPTDFETEARARIQSAVKDQVEAHQRAVDRREQVRRVLGIGKSR